MISSMEGRKRNIAVYHLIVINLKHRNGRLPSKRVQVTFYSIPNPVKGELENYQPSCQLF